MQGLTETELIKAFTDIGINQGTELEVHSSLSSFGYVEGGADTVISALKKCCGDSGSIFMPALRLSKNMELTEKDKSLGITAKIKILPPDCTKTAMGIIADTFRNMPDTKTGGGIMRISGWGKNADKAVMGGLDWVINNGGMALLLGVDIYKLTAMHYAENALPKEITDIFAPSEEANKLYPSDKWLIEAGEPPVKAWYTIQDMAYQNGFIKGGHVGKCKYMFFKISDVVGLYHRELLRDPFKLYGLNFGDGGKKCL